MLLFKHIRNILYKASRAAQKKTLSHVDPIIFHRAEGYLRRACERLHAWATISSGRIVERGRLHRKQTGSALLTVRGAFNGPAILSLDTKIDDDMRTAKGFLCNIVAHS